MAGSTKFSIAIDLLVVHFDIWYVYYTYYSCNIYGRTRLTQMRRCLIVFDSTM